MRQISSHIKYFAQILIKAGATSISIDICEDWLKDTMTTRLAANGWGMTNERFQQILHRLNANLEPHSDPQCIDDSVMRHRCLTMKRNASQETVFEAVWKDRSLNRPPQGCIAEVVTKLITKNPTVNFVYTHLVNENKFWITTNLIASILADIPLSHPAVGVWLTEYLTTNIARLHADANKCC